MTSRPIRRKAPGLFRCASKRASNFCCCIPASTRARTIQPFGSFTPTALPSGVVSTGLFSLTNSSLLCSCLCMSAAAPPTPTTDAVPPRASVDLPAALGRVVSLVRKLIDYGRQLAGTVQQRAAAPGFSLFAKPFGTTDLAVILARITNGLRRAAALEVTLLPARCPRPGPHAAAHPPASRTRAARRTAVSTAGRPARTPARQPPRGPAPRAPAHGSGNRRRGASPPGRCRHRRHLP